MGSSKGTDINSPVTTPDSTIDEDKFLVPYYTKINRKKIISNKWYSKEYIPMAMLLVSFLQLIFYLVCTENLHKSLRFEPNKLQQLWRFVTYMLLHEDWLHLILNIIMQILFAWFLEYRHSSLRVFILYIAGGITGVFGASCVDPDLVVGASGGVYALLISHISDILKNFEHLKYKIYRCVCIIVIVISDIVFNLVHMYLKDEPSISWGAHVIGGVSGLCLGLILYKCDSKSKTKQRSLFCIGVFSYIFLLILLVILTLQIKKCTPANAMQTKYIYFC